MGGGGLTSIDPPDLHICCNLMKLTSLHGYTADYICVEHEMLAAKHSKHE